MLMTFPGLLTDKNFPTYEKNLKLLTVKCRQEIYLLRA